MIKAWQIFKIITLLSASSIPKSQTHLTSQMAKEVGKFSLSDKLALGHIEKKVLECQPRDKVNLLNQGSWRQIRKFSNESELNTVGKDYLVTERGKNELKLIGKGFMPIIDNELECFLVEKNEKNLLLVKENELEIIRERKDMYFSCLEGNDQQKFDFAVRKYLETDAIAFPFAFGKQGKRYATWFLLEKNKIQDINKELYPKN